MTSTRPAPKFKVGDKVRINANGPRLYWGHTLDKFILKFIVGVIESQDDNYDETVGSYIYYPKDFEGYSISEQDLELVEEAVISPNTNARPHTNARKHADLIIAWANGAEIEYYRDVENEWVHVDEPCWEDNSVYRIKPEELPVVALEFFMQINATKLNPYNLDITYHQQKDVYKYNVKATVDKNTGKLLSIEMI